MALEFTDGNFQTEVIDSGQLAVVDFWAEWCGPCKAIGPVIEELANDYEGQVRIGKVNVDDNQELTFKYKVRGIPTVLFIKNGEVVDRHVGIGSKADFEAKIKAHIDVKA